MNNVEFFAFSPEVADALNHLTDLMREMNRITATLPSSHRDNNDRSVINARNNMNDALFEAQAAERHLLGDWTSIRAMRARADFMKCYDCVIKAVKVIRHLLDQRLKKIKHPVPDQVTGDRRPASPTGSPAAKRHKTDDNEHGNEAMKLNQSTELAKSPTPPSAPIPSNPPKSPTPPSTTTLPPATTPPKASAPPTRAAEDDDYRLTGEKIQRLAEIRARAARDIEAVWARANAEIAEIKRREEQETEELL